MDAGTRAWEFHKDSRAAIASTCTLLRHLDGASCKGDDYGHLECHCIVDVSVASGAPLVGLVNIQAEGGSSVNATALCQSYINGAEWGNLAMQEWRCHGYNPDPVVTQSGKRDYSANVCLSCDISECLLRLVPEAAGLHGHA